MSTDAILEALYTLKLEDSSARVPLEVLARAKALILRVRELASVNPRHVYVNSDKILIMEYGACRVTYDFEDEKPVIIFSMRWPESLNEEYDLESPEVVELCAHTMARYQECKAEGAL